MRTLLNRLVSALPHARERRIRRAGPRAVRCASVVIMDGRNDPKRRRRRPHPPEMRAGWFNLSLLTLVVLIVIANVLGNVLG